jgi:hypothetical protein
MKRKKNMDRRSKRLILKEVSKISMMERQNTVMSNRINMEKKMKRRKKKNSTILKSSTLNTNRKMMKVKKTKTKTKTKT